MEFRQDKVNIRELLTKADVSVNDFSGCGISLSGFHNDIKFNIRKYLLINET